MDNELTSDFNPFSAESRFPQNSNNVFIRINRCYTDGEFKGIDRTPEEILVDAAFELNNAKNRVHCQELANLVESGNITKRDYALAAAKDEYLASLDTGKFFPRGMVAVLSR